MAEIPLFYPSSFETKIGFTQIREILVNHCETVIGRELALKETIAVDVELTQLRLAQTAEALVILSETKDFPDLTPADIREAIAKGMIDGMFLEIHEWMDIRGVVHSVRLLGSYFIKKEETKFPHLKQLVSRVTFFPVLLEKIDQVFNKTGQVRDSASPALRQIRADIQSTQTSLSRKLEKIIIQARNEGFIEKDAQAMLRDGRLVIPVSTTHKRKIKGYIHDESATGKTTFVEPAEMVEMNNELRELELAEKREVMKILIELTRSLRPYFPDLTDWNQLIGELDFIRSRARLSMVWDGIVPEMTDEPIVDWHEVRHPLLVIVFKKEKKPVVSQSITLDRKNRILLISGPNAGGKSVCMKTVGLVQYLLQFGVLPPMQEGSRCGIFTHFLIDIGDEQSLENDLSTYSSHLYHMRDFLKQVNSHSLFLIDEFGSGTEPLLGGAIAEAILTELIASGATGVITTHYGNLKHYGASAEGIMNGAMLFDSQKMKPLFKLETGKPGSSFAFEIARNIGLPESVLKQAADLVGTEHIRFDKNLREISRDKRYWERKRQEIKDSEKEVSKLLVSFEEMTSQIKKERKAMVDSVKRETDNLLNEVNRRIENTIREIKEKQADKEATKTIRKDFESFRNSMGKKLDQMSSQVDPEIEKAEKERRKIRAKLKMEPPASPKKESKPLSSGFVRGQKIQIRDKEMMGEVVEVGPRNLVVAIGHMITTVPVDQVMPVGEEEYSRKAGPMQTRSSFAGFDLEMRRMEFKTELDIRGHRADEALQKVTEYIDTAVMVGATSLRILHGKGDGILRHLVREYLSGVDVVRSCQDEDVRFGGSGITLVTLSY